jgi:hypothetical protein
MLITKHGRDGPEESGSRAQKTAIYDGHHDLGELSVDDAFVFTTTRGVVSPSWASVSNATADRGRATLLTADTIRRWHRELIARK